VRGRTYLLLQVYKDAGDDFWPSWQHIVNGEPVRADLEEHILGSSR